MKTGIDIDHLKQAILHAYRINDDESDECLQFRTLVIRIKYLKAPNLMVRRARTQLWKEGKLSYGHLMNDDHNVCGSGYSYVKGD